MPLAADIDRSNSINMHYKEKGVEYFKHRKQCTFLTSPTLRLRKSISFLATIFVYVISQKQIKKNSSSSFSPLGKRKGVSNNSLVYSGDENSQNFVTTSSEFLPVFS